MHKVEMDKLCSDQPASACEGIRCLVLKYYKQHITPIIKLCYCYVFVKVDQNPLRI